MRRFILAGAFALFPTFVFAQSRCPCVYTFSQEQQDVLASALQSARQWYAVLAAGSTAPRGFLLQQREVEALWEDLAKQEKSKNPTSDTAPKGAPPH